MRFFKIHFFKRARPVPTSHMGFVKTRGRLLISGVLSEVRYNLILNKVTEPKCPAYYCHLFDETILPTFLFYKTRYMEIYGILND